ncbi:hypothetical protein I553_10743 [Mycobacterium xenopi 4042]|uniref:Uncharacterized protein n=1 Tax=Mycobacterium xenopi 4042 TaxID=1299334 RepID=X8DBK9_MYCXE|nr:hypothetical protein I553_10743 [Mycobacterium xenopi 4042]
MLTAVARSTRAGSWILMGLSRPRMSFIKHSPRLSGGVSPSTPVPGLVSVISCLTKLRSRAASLLAIRSSSVASPSSTWRNRNRVGMSPVNRPKCAGPGRPIRSRSRVCGRQPRNLR